MKDYVSDICNNLKSDKQTERKIEINESLLLTPLLIMFTEKRTNTSKRHYLNFCPVS